jgi:hypothetical protein
VSQNEAEIFVGEMKMLQRLFFMRGEWVMLESDLAELFHVDTKTLRLEVIRNRRRFAKDLMFKMSGSEFRAWRNDPGLTPPDKKAVRNPPFCFTERGLMMLFFILKNKTAIELSVRIVIIFVNMSSHALTQKKIRPKLAKLEKKAAGDDECIRNVFVVLEGLINKPTPTIA